MVEPEPNALGEEIEKTVKNIARELGSVKSKTEFIEKKIVIVESFMKLAEAIGEWKMSTCKHQENGVCRLWRFKREILDTVKNVQFIRDGEVYRAKVSTATWICGLCPLYKPKTSK